MTQAWSAQENTRIAVVGHVIAAFIAGAGLGGCFNGPQEANGESSSLGQSKQALQEEAPDQGGEGHSPKAIVVHWTGAPAGSDGAVKNLTVRIRNTTPTQREARLVLTARGATGQEETLDLGKLSIDAEAATDIDVPVQALPVQTAGTATTVQVVAHYESPNNAVAGTPLPENSAAMTSHSEWRYVTHDSDFENATVRTNHEEAARNGDLFFQGALPELEELRTADPLSPNVIQANEATKVPTQMIVSLPHGAIPSPTPSSGEE